MVVSVKKSLRIAARAKINLFLEVVRRRPDGYHDLRSVVVPLSLHDSITIRKSSRISTTVKTSGLPREISINDGLGSANLATRAAKALKRATGYRGGAAISIVKRIPVGGGLGGGSADAAAVLKGLNSFWGTNLEACELAQIGAVLGCDVPSLVLGGAVCMEGLGEKVTPVSVCAAERYRDWWVVLANPLVLVPTGDIYKRYKPPLTSPGEAYKRARFALERGDLGLAVKGLFNGLQPTTFRKYPLIAILAERMKSAGCDGVLLCGSGATVFGVVGSERRARKVAGRVREALNFPAWIRVARILPDGVMAAHGPLEA